MQNIASESALDFTLPLEIFSLLGGYVVLATVFIAQLM
jgi:hypothetical protein